MRQFDIVQLGKSAFVLVLQADLLDTSNTCVVAPLVDAKSVKATARLHPTVTVSGRSYVVATEKMSAVLRSDLKKVAGSMKDRDWDIRRALDLVFVGV